MRSLVADDRLTGNAAAEVLAAWAGTEHDPKDRLMQLLRTAPSASAAATTLYALGQGWAADADVGELASIVRQSGYPALALQAIRIRTQRMESDATDLERFFAITYGRRSIHRLANWDLLEHFAATQRDKLIGKLHAAIADMRDHNPHHLKPLLAALVICDPTDTTVQSGLLEFPQQDLRDLLLRGDFPLEKVIWTPELIHRVERCVTPPDSQWIDGDLYYLSKALRTEVLKARLLQNFRHGAQSRFWAARALVECWGPEDPEVSAALLPFLEASPEDVATVAEVLPAVVPDAQVCRAALVRALRGGPHRVDFLFEGLRRLGVSQDDDEAFAAAWQARTGPSAPHYPDQWPENIIRTFPRRPEVRSMAVEELTRRGGAIGAIADSYCHDIDMLGQVLQVLAPQSLPARQQLIAALTMMAPGNSIALTALDAARQDADGAVCFEATVSWVESLAKRGVLEARHIEWLVSELNCVDGDYESRRAAAVVGLAIAQHLERFATAVDPQGRRLNLYMSERYARVDERYLRRVLEHWDGLARGLGGEARALERLRLTPEGVLPVIDPGHPNAPRLFELMMQKVRSGARLSRHVPMSALARFAPRGEELRELILAALTKQDPELWERLVAGEILAENFADDIELRRQVVADLLRAPPGHAEAALADLLLRHPDAQLETTLRERAKDGHYDVATHFKLVAALSSPPEVIESLEDILSRDLTEPACLHLARWIPAILKRIEKDPALQAHMLSALTPTAPPSVKASFVSLLARTAGVDQKLRTFAADELQRTESDVVPQLGFDLASQSYRLVRHVLLETIG